MATSYITKPSGKRLVLKMDYNYFFSIICNRDATLEWKKVAFAHLIIGASVETIDMINDFWPLKQVMEQDERFLCYTIDRNPYAFKYLYAECGVDEEKLKRAVVKLGNVGCLNYLQKTCGVKVTPDDYLFEMEDFCKIIDRAELKLDICH